MNMDYFKNSSYIKSPQDYERLSMNLNLNGKKGKFKYGAKIGYTQSDKENFNSYVGETAVGALVSAIPTMPVYDANRLGGFGGTTSLTQKAISLNVIGFNNLIENNGQRNRFIGDVWGEFEIVKGLKYKIDASFDRLDYENNRYIPQSDLGWYYITTKDEASLDISTGSTDKTFFNNILTYSLDVDKHKFDVLGGFVQERTDSYNHWSRGVGYEYGEISMLQYADATSTGERKETITGKSYISRINYSYDDRYLLQANFRQDKTSLFSEKNNTANNYSFSGAWKLSNEKFIHLPEWVSNIKLRGSYGKLGNNTIPPYFFSTTTNGFAGYDFDNKLAPGTTVVASLDPDVKWEDVKTSDVAVELGLFNNDLQFTAEYFVKNSTNLLVDVPIPFSTGAFPAVIAAELERYLPFLATTKILMAAVKAGVGREVAHEVIKEHAVKAALAMREGQANTMLDALAADARIPLDRKALDQLISAPLEFTGDARQHIARVVSRIEAITSAHPAAAQYKPGAIR